LSAFIERVPEIARASGGNPISKLVAFQLDPRRCMRAAISIRRFLFSNSDLI